MSAQSTTREPLRSNTPNQTRPAPDAALFRIGIRRQPQQTRLHSFFPPAQHRRNPLPPHARLDPPDLPLLRASRHSPAQPNSPACIPLSVPFATSCSKHPAPPKKPRGCSIYVLTSLANYVYLCTFTKLHPYLSPAHGNSLVVHSLVE